MKKNILHSLLLFAFLLSALFSTGQTVQLTYKTKGKTADRVNISLSDSQGKEGISPADFQKSNNLYFAITALSSARKEYFKENDIADYFAGITLQQGDEKIKQNGLPLSFSDEKGKFNRIIISFEKDQVKLYEPFSFVNNIGESEKIRIKENFLPSYDEYANIFKKGTSLLNDKQYTEAFKTFLKITTGAKENPEISSFSFYKKSIPEFTEKAIKGYLDSLTTAYNEKQKQFSETKSKAALDDCEMVMNAFKNRAPMFVSYLQSALPDSKQQKEHFEKISQEINNKYLSDLQTFKKENLALLEHGTYSTYKFYLFVDVLSRMLCHTDSLQIIQGKEPLDMSTLDDLPQKKNELINTGWMDQFKTLTELLNDNIDKKKTIFDASVLANLKAQDSLERQPYYEIFTAFNNLGNNPGAFYNSLNKALIKCSDDVLLNDIDLWLVSYKMTKEGLNENNVSSINKGIIAIKNGQWNEAESIFNILKRQSNDNPVPWFYSATIQYHQNQVFSAQAQFSRALELYPYYLAPHQFIFDILLAQKQYTELLAHADKAIATFNIWYYHYMKAMALVNLQKTNDAINEIQNQCIPLNKWDTKQYYLLGDAYLKQNNFDKARAAYAMTREIDPFSESKMFDDKMRTLIKQQQDYVQKQQEAALKKQQDALQKQQQEQIKKQNDTTNQQGGL
ncbi:MAG: hypothetical protein JXR71_02580 [Bacteroidales bacterium]|nr:hypothetical protein [Bacteroidales bacterium]